MTPGYGPEGQCWLWTGSANNKGYGVVGIGSVNDGSYRNVLVHRLSYVLAHPDTVLDPGRLICHECDIPRCVNPEDLWVGTQLDNMCDCVAKGRNSTGESSGAACFDNVRVLAIRDRVDLTHGEAAREFGVSYTHVLQLRSGKSRVGVGGIRPLSDYKKDCMGVDVILEIRRRVDMSHADIARKLGLSPSYVSNLRSGRVRPDLGGIRPLSDYKKGRPGPK